VLSPRDEVAWDDSAEVVGIGVQLGGWRSRDYLGLKTLETDRNATRGAGRKSTRRRARRECTASSGGGRE
jgi:hypothetical protein